MAVAQRMSEADYEAFVLSGAEGLWELHDGVLVEKPGMSWEHLNINSMLGHDLQSQLDPGDYRVLIEGRVRRPTDTIFLPDFMVVPTAYGDPFRARPGALAIFPDPLPLVAEIWSATTGDYDLEAKIPVYQQRDDLEIWRLHPYERTLTSWVRQPDGTYRVSIYRSGVVALSALPEVKIDLDQLFAV